MRSGCSEWLGYDQHDACDWMAPWISAALTVTLQHGRSDRSCDRSINTGDGELFGLPVVGFAVQKYVNGAANSSGALANYGIATA